MDSKLRRVAKLYNELIDLAENLCDLCSNYRFSTTRTIDGDVKRCCKDCAQYVDKAEARKQASI